MDNLSNEQLDTLVALAEAATPGKRLLTTINQNPRGLAWYQQVIRVTDNGMLGGVPAPNILMQLSFIGGDTHTVYAADGDIMYHNPGPKTKADAAFIAAADPDTVKRLARDLQQLRAALAQRPAAGEAESGAPVVPQDMLNSFYREQDELEKLLRENGYHYMASRQHDLSERMFAALRAATAATGAAPEAGGAWVSVKERRPKSGEMVLAFNPNAYRHPEEVSDGRISLNIHLNGVWNHAGITHWLPLPQAPLATDAEQQKGEDA